VLHFDLSQGCTARALCAALIDLGASLKAVETALAGVQFRYADKSLDFLDASGRSLQSVIPITAPLKPQRFKAKIRWHKASANAIVDTLPTKSVTDIPEFTLSPIPSALFQKCRRLLLEAGHTPTQQELHEITAFCVLLSDLDPKALSATRIPLSFSPENPHTQVLLKLSESIPVYERQWPAPSCDPAGLALMKACVSHFGARGDSRLIKLGLGFDPEVRALLCDTGAMTSEARLSRLIQITAYITDTNSISELTHRLNQIGAKKLWTSQVLDQSTQPRTLITVIASETDQNKIIETLLILGQATDVNSHIIEQHALQKRTVSVTLGRGQKLQVCRVVEYLWGDRILRADPLSEDLNALAKANNQFQETVRADVLSAWKNRTL
jgi:uncharacterized protein (DUF111 family)